MRSLCFDVLTKRSKRSAQPNLFQIVGRNILRIMRSRQTLAQLAMIPFATCVWFFIAQRCDGCQSNKSLPATSSGDVNAHASTEISFTDRDYPPVTKVILYSIGVGHVGHTGEVDGAVRFNVPFSAGFVDDSLKSLVFTDSAGGFVRAIEYQTAPDEDDVAAEQMGQPLTLAQLFQSLRGESLVAETADQRVEGTIIGVENRRVGESFDEFIVLLTERGFESISLTKTDRFQFPKLELQEQLRKAMAGVVNQRDEVQESLSLLFEGTGKRRIGFGYVIDVPVWRMTYRMSIEDKKGTLQGWAHVDNTTGMDWNNVVLELRSGRPFAIHTDLFEPITATRSDAGQGIFGLGPDADRNRISPESRIPQTGGFEKPMSHGGQGGGGGGGFGGGGLPDELGGLIQNAIEVVPDDPAVFRVGAQQGKAGQLVNFKLENPVTLLSGNSAALPVFSRDFEFRKVSRFTLGQSSVHPIQTLEWVNASGLPLIPGPTALFENGAFVGDAGLARVEVGAIATIDYGIDQSTSVEAQKREPRAILSHLIIRDGNFETVNRVETELVFSIKNQDSEQHSLTLFVPLPGGSRFLGTQPTKQDGPAASFSVEIEGQAEHELSILLARDERQAVAPVTPAVMQTWLSEPNELQPAIQEALRAAIALEHEIASMEAGVIAVMRLKKSEWIQVQNRARENYQAIQAKETEKAQPFLDRIMEAETAMAEIDKSLKENQEGIAALIEKRKQVFKPLELPPK